MGLSKEFMVAELKRMGYDNIKVHGGVTTLDKAPQGNIFYMYQRITGKRQVTVEQQKKVNQLKGV